MSGKSVDAAVRELYLEAAKGPLRVVVRDALPPWLRAGDRVRLERVPPHSLERGALMGVRAPDDAINFLRVLGHDEQSVLGLARRSLFRIKPEMVLGRVAAVEGPGPERAVEAGDGLGARARLALDETRARLEEGGRKLELRRYLTRLYWDVNENFMDGVPESGDILVTDRCPVGCRFCLYSCVAEGSDMPEAQITAVARAFHQAGVPRVRILGGEPFLTAKLALDSFLAVKRAYEPERIIVLSAGNWEGSASQVAARLDPVAEAGLRHLHLSFDSFHLERFPLENYDRILERSSALGLEPVLSVHYSAGLAPYLPRLLELKRRHPFTLRLLTVSQEGRAELLSDAELSVAGVMDFRRALLEEPGLKIRMEDSTCFRWTVFPNGDLSFCCKQHPKNMAGNLEQDSLHELSARLQRQGARNRLRIARFALQPKGDLSYNPCLSCPLKAR